MLLSAAFNSAVNVFSAKLCVCVVGVKQKVAICTHFIIDCAFIQFIVVVGRHNEKRASCVCVCSVCELKVVALASCCFCCSVVELRFSIHSFYSHFE